MLPSWNSTDFAQNCDDRMCLYFFKAVQWEEEKDDDEEEENEELKYAPLNCIQFFCHV